MPTKQPDQGCHSYECTVWCIYDSDDPGWLLASYDHPTLKQTVIASLGKKIVGKIFNILDPMNVLKRWSRVTKEYVLELSWVKFSSDKLIVTFKSYVQPRVKNECFSSFKAISVEHWPPTRYSFFYQNYLSSV